MDVTHTARGRPETNNQKEIIVNILHNELHAAMCLMERRKRWLTEGMRNAESAVGMEIGCFRNGKVLTGEEMNIQTMSLVEILRTTQNRAERSTLAALEQQCVADNLMAYAKRMTAQGRIMMNKSEQKL